LVYNSSERHSPRTNFCHDLNSSERDTLPKKTKKSITTWTTEKKKNLITTSTRGDQKKNGKQPEQKFDVNKPPCMYHQRKNELYSFTEILHKLQTNRGTKPTGALYDIHRRSSLLAISN
jgi:hypothetical protein